MRSGSRTRTRGSRGRGGQFREQAVLEHAAREPGDRGARALALGHGDAADRVREGEVHGRRPLLDAAARVGAPVEERRPVDPRQSLVVRRDRQARELAAGSRACASSHIGPWPSKLASARPSTIAAIASNTRPAALERGEFTPRCQASRTIGSGMSTGQSTPASQPSAAALRQGERPALSPPGRRKLLRLAVRRHAPGRPVKVSPPQSVPSVAIAHAVPGEHDRRPSDAVLRRPARTRGHGDGTPSSEAWPPPAPSAWSCSLDARRRAIARLDVVQALQVRDDLREDLSLRSVPMSPTCGETTTRRPQASAIATFRCPPTASTGSGSSAGSSSSSGAMPRPRRMRPAAARMHRTTASSAGRTIGRSWCRKASATAASLVRASAGSVITGSPLTLPEVATTGPPKAASSR